MPSNLTTGQVLPGFFGFVEFNSVGAGSAPTRRALLWGYSGASGIATPNRPILPASQQEADDFFERGSDLARAYAAAVSQPESQGADVWCLPITPPSAGVASVHKLKVIVPGTNPSKSGTIQLWCCSQAVPAVGFTTSDTVTTIGDALASAFNLALDLPLGTVTNAAGVLSIPYVHKGQTGEDLPLRCNVSPNGTGVSISCGTATFVGAAGATGSVVIYTGTHAITTAITSGQTAATIETNVIASLNADTFPFSGLTGGSGIVELLMNNDRDINRVSAALITTTTTTVNLTSGATDGTGSATSLTYNGTQGTGLPVVTTALVNLAEEGPFRSWMSPWNDTTTLGTLATNIESASDGSITGQKQQTLTFGDFHSSSVAGAIPAATSPAMTTSAPHYALAWTPSSAVQMLETASRLAAARAALWLDTPNKNWNGFQVKGNAKAPILVPSYTPTDSLLNTALRTYGLAPVVKGPSGNLEVIKGRTTSLSNDMRLWAWSAEAQAAYHEVDLGLYLRALFNGGSLLRYSEPKAPGVFDAASIKSAVQTRMRFWETNGNYDGAALLSPAVTAVVNVNNINRVDVKFPESPVLDLDQIVFVGQFTSPST